MKKQVILFTTCQQNFNEELKKYIFNSLYNDIKNNDKYDFYVLYNKQKKSDLDLYLDGVNVISFDNEYILKNITICFWVTVMDVVHIIHII